MSRTPGELRRTAASFCIGVAKAFLVLAILSCNPSVFAQDQKAAAVVDDARVRLSGKVIALRHLLAQSSVKYDEAGRLIGNTRPGDWTLHSHLKILDIRLEKQTLYIVGDRVALSFEGEVSPKFVLTRDELEIQINTETPFDIENEFRKAFLTSTEKTPENLPAHWQRIAHCVSASTNDCPSQLPDSVSQAGGSVREPRLKKSTKPSYTQLARAKRLEGQLELLMIVDPKGEISHIEVKKPMGLGLDEQSIRSVMKWKFEPGTKDGKPVSVYISVLVNFSLKR